VSENWRLIIVILDSRQKPVAYLSYQCLYIDGFCELVKIVMFLQ